MPSENQNFKSPAMLFAFNVFSCSNMNYIFEQQIRNNSPANLIVNRYQPDFQKIIITKRAM